MAKRNRSARWRPASVEGTAHALDRAEVLLAADRAGLAKISSPALARRAGLSTTAAWDWLRGKRVSDQSDRLLRLALGLPLRATRRAA